MVTKHCMILTWENTGWGGKAGVVWMWARNSRNSQGGRRGAQGCTPPPHV